MSVEILRPSGDGATHTLVCSTGTTHYALVDEAVKDTGDYVEDPGAAGTDLYTLPAPSVSSGVINSVTIKAYIKGTTSTAWRLRLSTDTGTTTYTPANTDEFLATKAYTVNPADAAAFEWSDVAALTADLYLIGVSFDDIKCYQLWVEINYTPLFFGSIECTGAGAGYAKVYGVLVNGTDIVKKQAQICDEPTFGTPLADSTELTADDEDTGDTISLIVSWTPSAAGTYYARLGVRTASEAALVWNTHTFVVAFPVISSVAVSSLLERHTITVTVSDDYADPPEVTVTIDGQAYPAHL